MISHPFNCLFIDVHCFQALVGLETSRDHVVKKLDVPNVHCMRQMFCRIVFCFVFFDTNLDDV